MRAIQAYGGTTEAAPAPAAAPRRIQAIGAEDITPGLHKTWARRVKRPRVEEAIEHERYLKEPTTDLQDDVLGWWKQHAYEYPCLARIARDYLAIPATSAPAERVFSGGADLVTDKRGSLDEETIRVCLCLKDWF